MTKPVLASVEGRLSNPPGIASFRSASRRWSWRAMALAALLESIVLAICVLLGASARDAKPKSPATQDPMQVTLEAPPPEAKPAPVTPPPLPTPKPKWVAKQPAAHPREAAPRAPAMSQPPAPDVSSTTPAPVPVPTPPEPATAPPAATTPGPDEQFITKLRAAVSRAAVFPPALRGSGIQTSVEVEFTFRDGVASSVRVVQPGRVAMLDRAAIAAVTHAVLPQPPSALAGVSHTFRVRVIFKDE
ncbi:TonB family protein [Pandoraea anhela]|uniref:TonB family protein n=1 Tax=Pandoraea anhela TaxID=2508295 RepID=A0A5E4Z7Z1_9BURK|nr:TonB family protein [Pandoraea anhela]VVE56797.1 TonB family protein [Pandoraea anhela]